MNNFPRRRSIFVVPDENCNDHPEQGECTPPSSPMTTQASQGHSFSTRMNALQKQMEVYGFALWVASFFALGMFLLWSFLPDQVLHSVGLYYYPDKLWALQIPAWLCSVWMTIFLGTIFYFHWNIRPLDSVLYIQDYSPDQYLQLVSNSKQPFRKTSTSSMSPTNFHVKNTPMDGNANSDHVSQWNKKSDADNNGKINTSLTNNSSTNTSNDVNKIRDVDINKYEQSNCHNNDNMKFMDRPKENTDSSHAYEHTQSNGPKISKQSVFTNKQTPKVIKPVIPSGKDIPISIVNKYLYPADKKPILS